MQIRVGYSEHEYLELDVVNNAPFAKEDSIGGTWLKIVVSFVLGGFRGKVTGELLADELRSFQTGLENLYKSLSGKASLSTLEGWLFIEIIGNGRGQMMMNGEIIENPGRRNTFQFELDLDQSFIPPILSDLEKIVKTFPA